MLLLGQRLVVVLPCGQHLVAGLWSAGSQCRRGTPGPGTQGFQDRLCLSAEHLEAYGFCARAQRWLLWPRFSDCGGGRLVRSQRIRGDEHCGCVAGGNLHARGDGAEHGRDADFTPDGRAAAQNSFDLGGVGCGVQHSEDVGMACKLDDGFQRNPAQAGVAVAVEDDRQRGAVGDALKEEQQFATVGVGSPARIEGTPARFESYNSSAARLASASVAWTLSRETPASKTFSGAEAWAAVRSTSRVSSSVSESRLALRPSTISPAAGDFACRARRWRPAWAD